MLLCQPLLKEMYFFLFTDYHHQISAHLHHIWSRLFSYKVVADSETNNQKGLLWHWYKKTEIGERWIVSALRQIKRVSTERHWKRTKHEKIKSIKRLRTKLKKDQNRVKYEEGESLALVHWQQQRQRNSTSTNMSNLSILSVSACKEVSAFSTRDTI